MLSKSSSLISASNSSSGSHAASLHSLLSLFETENRFDILNHAMTEDEAEEEEISAFLSDEEAYWFDAIEVACHAILFEEFALIEVACAELSSLLWDELCEAACMAIINNTEAELITSHEIETESIHKSHSIQMDSIDTLDILEEFEVITPWFDNIEEEILHKYLYLDFDDPKLAMCSFSCEIADASTGKRIWLGSRYVSPNETFGEKVKRKLCKFGRSVRRACRSITHRRPNLN